jgi:hypothetical protein
VDDEHQFWPFTGEYWRDELGYYRYKLANKCGRTGEPEQAAVAPSTEPGDVDEKAPANQPGDGTTSPASEPAGTQAE